MFEGETTDAPNGTYFSAHITDRTRNVTGREWVFAETDRWLANPDSFQIFVITSDPSSDKTAIIARSMKTLWHGE